jgi:hypothetical protein
MPDSRIERLATFLRTQDALAAPVTAAPNIESLVRYLSGALSDEAARQVERGLIAHSDARTLLRATRTEFQTLKRLTWTEVSERARAVDFTAQVAQVRLVLAAERVRAAPSARAPWLTQSWTEVRRQVTEGLAEAQTAWAGFLAFGAQWQAGLQMPRLAAAKSAASTLLPIAGDLPEGVEIAVDTAEIAADGALNVVLVVRDAQGRPTDLLADRPVHLALRVEGETWPLATGIIVGDRAAWNLPAFGEILNAPRGPLPATFLQAIVGQPEMSPPERQTLLAEVRDARGQIAPEHAVVLRLEGTPRWEAEQFIARIALPSEVRAAYPTHQLLLEVVISAQDSQLLGAWPVSAWNESSRTLTASCPGSPDVTLPFATALRAWLQGIPT